MPTLSIKDCLGFGWRTFTSRPWILIGAGVVVFLIQMVLSIPEKIVEGGPLELPYALLSVVAALFIQMGTIHFILKAHDDSSSVKLDALWHPKPFWRFLGAAILMLLAIVGGLILLIVPGIIVAIALTFTLYLVIDKGLGPVEAMKESWRLTKGRRWKLFGLSLAIVGINLLGMLALFVGLVVTVPITMLATAHAYRVLSGQEKPAETPIPIAATA